MDELIGGSSIAKHRLSSTITSDDLEQMYDGEANQAKDVLITQFAQRVLEFSSQYGSDSSISYTACNITGRPSKFPNYGDFPETFAMVCVDFAYIFLFFNFPSLVLISQDYFFVLLLQRTYGKWWDLAPSRNIDIQPQTLNPNMPQDFIVIQFEDFVYPSQICIVETYNPGAIVKLWAFTITEKWICLWENDGLETIVRTDSRVFSPPIKDIKIPTRIIRMEFSHRYLDYFTEIDAVMLQGELNFFIEIGANFEGNVD